jgi:hypothetical protein
VNRRIVLAAASALALGTFAQIDTAEAGRYRFSGGGYRARVHGSVHYSRPAYRSTYRPFVSGRIYVGPRITYYPRARYYYYPRYYYYRPVPSYYGVYSQNYYYPVQPAPRVETQTAIVAPPPRPQLPRFGVGLFGGGVSVDDKEDSDNLGVFGRLRLTPGLIVEAEVGKTTYTEDLREDRRLGASLIYEFGAYNKLAPYVRGGLGVQQADVAGEFQTRQNYGELGVGLRYAFTPNLHIGFDVRTGTRATADQDETGFEGGATARSVAPPAAGSGIEENYVSGTFWGGLYF